ncbi:MAG: phosphoribosylformylglycinamidine synthase subunit PurS [Candidatus Hydrothermarchaeaceae archaeon]
MLWEVKIAYKPGVQDTEGESTKEGLMMLGFKEVEDVRTAKVYRIEGDCSRDDIEQMCRRLLANPVSQDYEIEEQK